MAAERRFAVDLSELRAVAIACNSCAARLSLKPENITLGRLGQCPACSVPWLSGEQTNGAVYDAPILRLLTSLARVAKEETRRPFRVLLEFDDPAK